MKAIMLYDGMCILCTQTQTMVKWLDWLGRVERLNAQDFGMVYQRFPELRDEDTLGEIYVQSNQGQWLVGFFGMRYLAWQLPLAWLALPILYFPGMNSLGPSMYRWVARRRYKINKLLGHECVDGTCKLY
jgi:predicted DCC family thiol-disulfide oxidoreductase YuxK